MKSFLAIALALGAVLVVPACTAGVRTPAAPSLAAKAGEPASTTSSPQTMKLPAPKTDGGVPLDLALAQRRSVRAFAQQDLTLEQVSQLLWAADGVTRPDTGGRTAPSASAVYPIEVYAARRDGLWRYEPKDHSLRRVRPDDARAELAEAAASQSFIAEAPLVVVITGSERLVAEKHYQRADRFLTLEAGHVCQNLLLEAAALGLGATPVGSLEDADVRPILRLPGDRSVFYVVPVGVPG